MKIELPYPVSTNIYYRNYRGFMTISKIGRAYKEAVRKKYSHITPTDDDYMLYIKLHPRMKKDGTAFAKMIDIDNSLKCMLDSLQGIIYNDDKQIKSILILKHDEPRENGIVELRFKVFNKPWFDVIDKFIKRLFKWVE